MFNPRTRFVVFAVITVMTLIVSLISPPSVLADDEIPPQEPDTSEVEVLVEGKNGESEGVPGEPIDSSEVEVLVEGENGESEGVSGEPIESSEGNVEDNNSTEELPAETISEVVEAMDEAGVVLADENGNLIPLATEVAAAALLFPDPIGCPPGVQPVTWGGTGVGCTASYASIQSAIDDVSVAAGWTIYIDPGTFVENVVVNKSVTLQGSGMGVTIVQPAISGPTCASGSICAGSSNVILVQADNVTIRDLTVDGNNPALNSGVFSNGVDVDARNGIITDHTNGALGVIDGLEVDSVEVKNIYLRGIYASDGGTFNIHDNVVDNVNAEYASIAIFNYGGSGIIANNTVSNANDGIAANWSTGTQFLNNTVTNSGTGVHTDNTQASDVISGNTISNGPSNSYGIFVFAPYAPVSVTNNTITNVDYGLTVSGNGFGDTLNTITFDNNKVTTNVIGAYVTTDVWGYFFSDVSAEFNNNVFTGGDYGFFLESNGAGEAVGLASAYGYVYDCDDPSGDCTLNVTGAGNSITGQNLFAASTATGQPSWFSSGAPVFYGIYNADLRGNWWGDASGPLDVTPVPDGCGITLDNPSGLGGDVSECILYDLWLASNPFAAAGGGGPVVDDGTPKPPVTTFSSGLFAFAGGPLSGETTEISCDTESVTLSVGDINVILVGLCGYEVALELVTEDAAQSALDGGGKFLYGVSITLLKDGAPVESLPADAQITVSFPEVGVPMQWNGSWAEVSGNVVGGRFEVQATPGVYILIDK